MVKDTNSVTTFADTINELQRSYNFFIDYFKLDKALFANTIITIQSSGRRNAAGWLSKGKWVNDANESKHEITLASDYLNRDINSILETLLHEIAHLKNAVVGIEDCTVSGYHNKHFKDSAEGLGLVVSKLEVGNKGYNITSLGTEANKAIKILNPDSNVYSFNSISVKGKGLTAKKYIAIFVSKSYDDKLQTLCDKTGKTRKTIVEELVDFSYHHKGCILV